MTFIHPNVKSSSSTVIFANVGLEILASRQFVYFDLSKVRVLDSAIDASNFKRPGEENDEHPGR
jgi:hypothetical protein